MAKKRAFTKYIGPIGTDISESNLVHQCSPSWLLTFIRWDVRDTLRAIAPNSNDVFQVRESLVVENDCVQVSVSSSKSTLTPSMTCTLLKTDVNYATAIAPGDFVFVNMLNWDEDQQRIALIARSKNPGSINGINDGFKGVFKVQGVREVTTKNPETGQTMIAYRINGFAFTEFNNTIYYNPYLRREDQGSGRDDLLFASNIGADYAQLITKDHGPLCQDLVRFLIQSFIGVGVTDRGSTSTAGSPITANTHFYIPGMVGSLLGVKSAKAAKDVYSYLFGLQKYSGSPNQDLATGMNPSNLGSSPAPGFLYTTRPVDGQTALKAEYWNQVKAWSIINQYVNQPLNEIYTCFRVTPNGDVMPTIVMRQVPFTTETFGKQEPFTDNCEVTKFLELPRWKVSTAMTIDADLGRDESARINFVQYYGKVTINKPDAAMSAQTAAQNYVHDINDVTRSGLRPYVVSSQFEDLSIGTTATFSRKWAHIIGDAVMGGHLKLNGTVSFLGLVDPICVGDNLEYDGTVYHIEEVTHACSKNASMGKRLFRTTLKLSNGVSISDSALSYSEMVHTNAYQDRKDNYENGNKSNPGVSEEQDTTKRPTNPAPTRVDIDAADKPFAQPGQVIKPIKDDE